MLDIHFIRENLDAVKANCKNRNVTADVDRVVALDDERRRLAQETQSLQQRQNELSKAIPKEKDAAKKQALVQEGRGLREKVAEHETRLKTIESEQQAVLLTIPNMSHPQAPVGTTAEDNKVLRRWGEPAISLPDLYQRGPAAIRDAATARKVVGILENHGWLIRIPEGAVISGVRRHEAWRVVRG